MVRITIPQAFTHLAKGRYGTDRSNRTGDSNSHAAYPSNTEHWWQGKGTESFIKGYQMIRTALYGDWGFLSSESHP